KSPSRGTIEVGSAFDARKGASNPCARDRVVRVAPSDEPTLAAVLCQACYFARSSVHSRAKTSPSRREFSNMATITEIADRFFVVGETGRGWEACKGYCTPDATFAAQAEPLGNVKSLRQYCDWMKDLLGFIPDGRYELVSFATDEKRRNVSAY